MTRDELLAALHRFENVGAASLTIPASQIEQWPNVRALVATALQSGTLTIAGIAAFPQSGPGADVTYQGRASLFPWVGTGTQLTLAVTATFSVANGGNPQLLIRAELPQGQWSLADTLGGLADADLAGVEFEAGFFLLASDATTVSDFPTQVLPGINFMGVLATAGPLAFAAPLLATQASRTVAGRVDLTQGSMPVLSLGAVDWATTSAGAFAGVGLTFAAALSSSYEQLPWFDPADPGKKFITVPYSSATILARLASGPAPGLQLSLSALPQSRFRTLSIEDAAQPIASLDSLKSLSARFEDLPFSGLIPALVPARTGHQLRRLELSLFFPDDGAMPRLDSLSVDVGMAVPDWPILPNGILTVRDLGARLTVFFDESGAHSTGSLYTTFAIVEAVPIMAELSIPRLVLTAEMPGDVTVSLASLMEAVMNKLTGGVVDFRPPIPNMEITRLEMAADVRDRSFGFGCDIVTAWSVDLGRANNKPLITLSLDEISFEIDYDGQLLHGAFAATAAVNDARFFFIASSPGGGAGWAFAGGLAAGSSLKVSELLLNFMGLDGPASSYGVPDLVIDRLDATLTTDSDNKPHSFTFDGGLSVTWRFSMFPGTPELKLAATVELEGLKTPGPVPPTPLRLNPPGRSLRRLPRAPPPAPLEDDLPWQISGKVEGTLSLYGLLISAGYQFSPDNSALIFGIWYKQRGLQATVTQKQRQDDPARKDRILTVRLGDLSLGEVLEYLIGLAVPGETRRLPTPWDVLYQIDFKNLSLVVNLDSHDVEVRYPFDNLDLKFASVTSIALVYKSVNGAGRVNIELVGEFLGQPFGDQPGEPLSWDVLNDPAPDVPGKGPKLIDLRYVGMGQHIALAAPITELKSVEKVIAALKAAMKPVPPGANPLTDPATPALRYDGNSNWMFGLDASILDTVSLSAVMFDPILYGGLISLSGPRAGVLAGLRFELLYRKITEQIGELSVDLRVPDAFRHLEFGAVSVTLGTIHLDIYTNGNFRIDLGFPHNGDFSVSFAVEVFPFVGEGGFYFAYLTGATSERVPLISNGTFSPVIEAGVGLSVGLGKDFQAGPLKAGLTIEVFGIFEGVFAPFHPYDRNVAADNYFWIQGSAGIVGTLYGSVDFVLIRADVSIVAKATVTFVIEAHRPSLVDLSLTVTAKASIKILFVRIHFSFDFTLEQSFTLGSATATPWIIGTSSDRLANHGFLGDSVRRASGRVSVPRLRQQRSQRPAPRLTRLSHARRHFASLVGNPDYRSLHRSALAAAAARRPHLAAVPATPATWVPVALFGVGTPHVARVQFLPMFTIADPASLVPQPQDDPAPIAANQVQIVLGFVAENSIGPDAHGHSSVALVAEDHLHHRGETGEAALTTMVDAFFRWAAKEGAGKAGGDTLSLLALEDLLDELGERAFQQATFGYGNLAAFLDASLHFEVAAYPSGSPGPTSGTFLPIFPGITATIAGLRAEPIVRDFSTYNPVSQNYADNLIAYFRQLLVDASAGAAPQPGLAGEVEPAAEPQSTAAASMAELVFCEYFALLTQASVQAAIALLKNYPYVYPTPVPPSNAPGPSLQQIAGGFPLLWTRVTLARGQRLVDLALATGHHPDHLAAANPLAARGASRAVDLPIGVTALSVAEDNADRPLAEDLVVPMTGSALAYQVRADQTLNGIAAAVRFVDSNSLTGAAVGAAAQSVVGLLRAGKTLQIPAFTYRPVAGDTVNFLTAFFQVRDKGVTGVPNLDWYEQAISTMNPEVLDWTAPGRTLAVPSGYLSSTPAPTRYTPHQKDDLSRIAATFAIFQAMNNESDAPATQPVTVPAIGHIITSTDTLLSLHEDFPGLDLDPLIAANVGAQVLTPLSVVPLPPFTAKIPQGQSLRSLAAAYDLSLADLVAIVGDIRGIFPAATPLTIRDVPALTVDDFVTQLQRTAAVNSVATQLSSFLAHGLRAPRPGDTDFTSLTPAQVSAGSFTGPLYGLGDLVGQQVAWPDTAVPATLTLTGTSGWLTFVAAATTGTDDSGIDVEMLAPDSAPASAETAAPGRIVATGTIPQIVMTIDHATFGDHLPSTEVSLHASAPVPLANFHDTPVHYNFQATQHWQAAVRPALPGGGNVAAPGEPSLWPLPATLRAAAGAGRSFGLKGLSLTAPPGAEGAALACYAWGVNVTVQIQRVAATDPGAAPAGGSQLGTAWVDGLYLVKGAAADDSDRLYDLWTYLARAQAAGTDSGSLYLLYSPNATGGTPAGYASDSVDRTGTVVLKTNLSTVTRDPGGGLELGVDPPAGAYSAALTDGGHFLTLLWEASVVVEGGFYLRYSCDGAGLPDFVFDDHGLGALQLLCLLDSQTAAAGGPLLGFNNVAVVGDNVDASATQVYAVRTDAGAPGTRLATAPPGSTGFEIRRKDPALETWPSAGEMLSGMLYGLVGYRFETGGGFLSSNEAAPHGPAPVDGDKTGEGPDVTYSQVVNVSRRAGPAGFVAQSNPWLPDPLEDPYAGVSGTNAATLSFTAHDLFGNKAAVTDPIAPVTIERRYTDRLIGIGDWPATSWSYSFTGTAPAAMIEIDGALQLNTYLPAPRLSSEKALRSASGHAIKFREAFYQTRRPNIRVGIETSLAPNALTPPLAPLLGYLSGACAFLEQIAALPIETHTITSGETLAAVGQAYCVSAEDLLRDNIERTVDSLFSASIETPVFERLKHGETLNAFAARVSLSAEALLGLGDNASSAVIPDGTDLVVPTRAVATVAGRSLADYAAAEQCTPADIARANAGTAGLVADGLTVAVQGATAVTAGSTFESLVRDFANSGVTTNAEEIATGNQAVPNFFAASGPVTTFNVDRRIFTVDGSVVRRGSVAEAVALLFGDDRTSFIDCNGALPGLIAEGTPLLVRTTTGAAPRESLRTYLAQAGDLSLAQFARANAAALMAPGEILLPGLLDPTPLAATPYAIQPDKILARIARLFGTSADRLASDNQDVRGLFVPDQTVAVPDCGSVTTAADDSLAGLVGKFPAATRPTLQVLIAAIENQAGLLAPEAALVCPVPVASAAGPAAALSIQSLADTFLTSTPADGLKLAKCNAALRGFLLAGATFTVEGDQFGPIGQWQTLANSLQLVNAARAAQTPPREPLDYDALLAALLGQPIVAPAAKVILPPPGAVLRAPLPAAPAVSATISQLVVSLTLTRPDLEIDSNFASVPGVKSATTTIAPKSAGETLSLDAFAAALATAYGGGLWAATSSRGAGEGKQSQYAVRFAAPQVAPVVGNAIRKLALGDGASYLALPPLATSLVSRSANVRGYVSGGERPFTDSAPQTAFQSVDPTAWAADFLATLDLLFSPAYASAAYAATAGSDGRSSAFDSLADSKRVLADKISAQLLPIRADGSALDSAAAKEALRQALSAHLSAGFATDAVIQVPAAVQAEFGTIGADAGGHRLSGKAVVQGRSLSSATTLRGLASAYRVSADSAAELLAATPNILAENLTLTLAGKSWPIGPHDSIDDGLALLGTTLSGFVGAFADRPLFRDGAQVTIDGYSTPVRLGDSLRLVADALDVGPISLALANKDETGLLAGIAYVGARRVEITEATSSLSDLARSLDGMDVKALAGAIADQPVLVPGVEMHILRWVPEFSLSAGKIGLDGGSGALTLLLSVKNRARHRRLFLNLDFSITALEYAIAPAELVDGYEVSKWLHFIDPLPETPAAIGGAVIDTHIGQLDVPIPLKAYPEPPRLIEQRARARFEAAEIAAAEPASARIAKAETWSYSASVAMQLAAQDTATITIGLNFRTLVSLSDAVVTDDPFVALAEYAANSAAIRTDLLGLAAAGSIAPPDNAAGRSAVLALADLARKAAGSWGFVRTPASSDPEGWGDGLTPSESYKFDLQTRTRPGSGGAPLLDSVMLVAAAGQSAWGPAGQMPALAYVRADGTEVQLQLQPPAAGADHLIYQVSGDVPDEAGGVYVIGYSELNAIRYQNARAGIAIARNLDLIPGRSTRPEFVYGTARVTFASPAIPNLQWPESLMIGSGAVDAVSTALGTLFGWVLGDPPADAEAEEKLVAHYGYRLAAAEGADSPLSPDDLVSMTPIFYRPTFRYEANVAERAGTAIADWFALHLPNPDRTAFLSFGVQVFSTMMPGRKQPLIDFGRLDYQLRRPASTGPEEPVQGR